MLKITNLNLKIKMKDLTIIIPVKEYESSMDELLHRAIVSCADNRIILIGKDVDKYEFKPNEKEIVPTMIQIKNESENLSYQHNVNMAVNMVETKYFSVLEYDDFYSNIWFNNVEKYIEYDTENVSGFLPLTEVVDYDKNEVIGYSNEAFWASSFSDELGYFDLKSAQDYLNFNTSGAVFKKDDFVAIGGLKESMKLVFWFEYILRSLHENKRLFVIPKIGYYHFVGRPDCLSETYAKEISEKEAEWWIDLAKKEFFFKKDRNKVYEE